MSSAPTTAILHDSQGLSIRRNAKNGFVVARLHYTADPRKRGEDWRLAARQGMSAAQFEREFEINYAAGMGERAFPEIFTKRSEIVLAEGPYFDGVWPQSLPMWGGFDYGANNPSSFHVYTSVDGVLYAIWEMYKPCRNMYDFVSEMVACPYWSRLRYIAHDPDMASMKQRDLRTGDVTSVRAQFESLGVRKWIAGVTDESAWIAKMRRHWCSSEVTFKILQSCPMLIEEFEQATFVHLSDKQLETQNYRESLIDKHNHSLDDCKYFMNSHLDRPVKTLKLPNLAASFGWGGPSQPVSPAGRERELGLVI